VKPRTLQRRLRIEALAALLAARLAVRFVSTRRLLTWAGRSPRRLQRFTNPDLAAQVAAAVDHVGSKTGAVCLPRALAAQAMLRRRGIASRLCLGVARDGRSLSAHAWVEIGQQIIIGEFDPASGPAFTQVAQFG
jgi:transglutaminase-like putative cysteine protease